MDQTVKVGIIGDYNPMLRSHVATNDALNHTASALSIPLNISWVPTESLTEESVEASLKPFHGLLCSPGSPYNSTDGALRAIRFAREREWPFLGT